MSTDIAPECGKCGVAVSSNYLTAVGKRWHAACFVCASCNSELSTNPFVKKSDGALWCVRCNDDHKRRTAPKCSKCGMEIMDSQYIEASGKSWHKSCLSCETCNTPLTGRYFTKKGKTYCQEHYDEHFSRDCHTCGKRVLRSTEQCIKALGHGFHSTCFVCVRCHKQMDVSDKFYEEHGAPLCLACHGP
ncbi:LIM domain-binding protein 3 [Pelomyxa schiedti]|nr:LIM domain-binding protein 3 [Pelomyxa schiedti]